MLRPARPFALAALLASTLVVGACGTGTPAYRPDATAMMQHGDPLGARSTPSAANRTVRLIDVTAATWPQYAAQFATSGGAPIIAQPGMDGTWTYRLGVGDILQLSVIDAPELTQPAGYRVEADGMIQVPFLGRLPAANLTSAELRADIARRLTQYMRAPQVDVRITDFNARHVSVVGAVRQPRRQALTETPLTAIDAINAAGGFAIDANHARVVLIRGGVESDIDLRGFLTYGTPLPPLGEGDVIRVDEGASPLRARAAAPAPAPMPEARLLTPVGAAQTLPLTAPVSLAQAAPHALHQGALGPTGAVVLLRRDALGITAYRVQGHEALAATPGGQMVLAPGDVVAAAPLETDPALFLAGLAPALSLLDPR